MTRGANRSGQDCIVIQHHTRVGPILRMACVCFCRYCSKPPSITWPPSCHSCLDMYLSIWKTFTRQGCVKTSVATIRQPGKCVQGCYDVFSFLWIPLPSNLMHFFCREPLNLKTLRERSLSQKNTEAITSTTSVTVLRTGSMGHLSKSPTTISKISSNYGKIGLKKMLGGVVLPPRTLFSPGVSFSQWTSQ